METIVFSSSLIQSWIFSIFLCVVAPLCFLWYIKKKNEAKIRSFFVGIAFSLLFSFILSVFVNIVLLQFFGLAPFFADQNHPVYSAVYGAVIAGLMAFLGSYIGLKFAMKNYPDKDNYLVFGLGKGAFECIMNGGSVYITNLIAAIFINSIGSNEYFKKLNLPAKELERSHSAFASLAATPGYTFILNATYLVLLLCVQTALAILIHKALTDVKSRYFLVVSLVLQILSYVPLYLSTFPQLQSSIILLSVSVVYTFAVVYFAYRQYHK